jgi:hypothetical protein
MHLISTLRHSIRISISFGLCALLLSGCNGGGDSSNQYVPPGALTQGIWRGTAALDGQDIGLLVGMIDDQGNANLILYSGDSQLRGSISSIGSEINNSFSYLSSFDESGDMSEAFYFVSGSVSAGSTLTASLSTSGSRMLNLDLHYDILYTRPASLPTISGNWRYSLSGYTINWQIAASGTLSGTDTNGCIYVGQVSVPNASHNLYQLRYQIEGCYAYTVNVSGLAILDDTLAANDTLLSAGTGAVGLLNTDSFVERLTRQ